MPSSPWGRVHHRRSRIPSYTQAIMHELSFGDSEIQFRADSGAGLALPTRPRIDPHDISVPMPRSAEE